MTIAARDPSIDPDTEWLDHVRPTGLVVAKPILKELGLTPLRQTALDSSAAAVLIADQGPALGDPWSFFRDLLGWPASHVAGVPGGFPLPEALSVSLPEQATLLAPSWAVKSATGDGFQLLVQLLPVGVDPDARGALEGWEASPHQRFERLLRETKVAAGVLVSDQMLRLVHAPAGETSGWLSFPLRQLGTVAGRPMLAGLKLLLGKEALFTNPENKRLPALLKASRDAQASVSQELAAQVLGALHELLRGLHAADRERIETLARRQPAHLYEGLLTVLMRLVFLLYAEDRDLLPSLTDPASRDFYDRNYSVRLLLAQLADDAVQNPDTMDERRGAWGRLLALFRLVHGGDGSGWIVARGGKLFDPDAFPFLEGRDAAGDPPRVLPLGDGCVLRLLSGLMTLKGERLSYRTLDVEQIGSVYETVMGFRVEIAKGPSLAIRAGKNEKTPVFVDCAALAKLSPDARQRELKESAGRAQLRPKVAAELKAAKGAEAVALALSAIVDPRGNPDPTPLPAGTPILQPTDERRRTGSHYTPRSLTEPIVRQALAPAFERLGPDATPGQILDLKVCDPAMGSGAFLVEACRQLGERLAKAWVHPGPRPAIPDDETEELHARRLVAQRCLYGVDRNPMATDLARLSLWLATLARDHEFTFLDHALKTGDSLVGLTRVQIAALHWDSGPGHAIMRYAVRDRFREGLEGRNRIRNAPDDVSRLTQERHHREAETAMQRVRDAGDAVIAAFFSGDKPKAREARRAEIEGWFAAGGDAVWQKVAGSAVALRQGVHPLQPFHWELEFPEVFDSANPGFDAIVGNPPFAGKNTIIASNSGSILDWLKALHEGAHGNADYVAHFFRRAWRLLRNGGAIGFVTTNKVSQGDTRESGLLPILREGGTIFSATRPRRWVGEAAVVVSIVHLGKDICARPALIDGKAVKRISAFLVEGDVDESPSLLAENVGKAFVGSYVLGMGFTFDDHGAGEGIGQPTSLLEMKRLIAANECNKECIFPYVGGEEINTHPAQEAHRFVIDFRGVGLDEIKRKWPEPLELVERKVRPLRLNQGSTVNPEKWWLHARSAANLFAAIDGMSNVLVTGAAAVMHHMIAIVPANQVFSHKLVVFAFDFASAFACLQCRLHELWSRVFGTTFGSSDALTYNPTQVFQTYPMPLDFRVNQALEAMADEYHQCRMRLMAASNHGLTQTYNRFHDLNDKELDIVELRRLHDEMDRAVLRAYGWDDLAQRARSEILTAAIEDDPKYHDRLFWPADFRAEVLARLLDLNAKRAAEEASTGQKAASGAPKARKKRGKRVLSDEQASFL